jgi:pantothenate kinase type III
MAQNSGSLIALHSNDSSSKLQFSTFQKLRRTEFQMKIEGERLIRQSSSRAVQGSAIVPVVSRVSLFLCQMSDRTEQNLWQWEI